MSAGWSRRGFIRNLGPLSFGVQTWHGGRAGPFDAEPPEVGVEFELGLGGWSASWSAWRGRP